MKRSYNNVTYRLEKRLVAFVDKKVKKAVLAAAKAKKTSISKEIFDVLTGYYFK